MNSLTPPSARSFDGRSSVSTDDPHRNAALRGASLAFRAPAPPPKPLVNTYSGSNGALAAATKAGTGRNINNVHTSTASVPTQAPTISSELPQTPIREVPLKRATSSSVETLRLSTTTNSSRQQSPSHIAATLAAAKSTPVSSIAPPSSTSTKASSRTRGQPKPAPERQDESIPATIELVQLFESRYGTKETNGEVKEAVKYWDVGKVVASAGDPSQVQHTRNIVSPTPIRPPIALRLSSSTLKNNAASLGIEDAVLHRPIKGNEIRQEKTAITSIEERVHKLPLISGPTPTDISKVPPTLPSPRHGKRPDSKANPHRRQAPGSLTRLESGSSSSSSSSYTSARDVLSRTSTIEKSISVLSNKSMPLPPFTSQPSFTCRPRVPRRASSRPEIRYTTNRIIPQLTVNSLANAMVASSIASSLASSRATSPVKASPSFSHSHSRSRHLFLPPHHLSRASSPTKPMRQTLRKSSTHSDEDDHKKHHYHILKKHPNKHAEGDRKRWRDSITERERKRYEGLWAANRGLLLDPSFSGASSMPETSPNMRDCVHSLVVKDIWSRSQLIPSMLEEIWALVDIHDDDHWLSREEFVVGVWLVDQCLKGRKLPVKVGESVWESVRILRGIQIRHGKSKG
ncbi:Increased rDNA silencing protein [Xylographa parallela]|nr:Increased rDNA silencing protein [Xylographa parallela]